MIVAREHPTSFGDDSLRELARAYGTPLYLYDLQAIRDNVARIRQAILYRPLMLHFALMSNANVRLLRAMRSLGIGAHVSSPGELWLAHSAGFRAEDVVVTGSNFGAGEVKEMALKTSPVNADSLSQLQKFLRLARVREVGLRLNSEMPLPRNVINAAVGPGSRLGIDRADLRKARRLAERNGARVVGLQMYIGTNLLSCRYFLQAFDELADAANDLPDLKYIDLGGGFGISYGPRVRNFDWQQFGTAVTKRLDRLSKTKDLPIEFKLEPGRSLIGSAAVLLATVVDVKKRNGTIFVGCNTSVSNFPRPYIYNQFHRVTFIHTGRRRRTCRNVVICGNTVAARDILSAPMGTATLPREGDLIVVHDVGAYGFSMSSHFCGRLRPAEVMVRDGKATLIRKREGIESLWNGKDA